MRWGFLIPLGGFSVLAAGFMVLTAGFQLVAMIEFGSRFTSAIPWVEMAVGVGLIVAGGLLASERAWARWPTLFVLLGWSFFGLVWALWLMFNGVFSLAAIAGPGSTALALVPFLASWAPLVRRAAEVAAVDAELGPGGGMFGASRPTGWSMTDLALYAGVAAILACLGLGGWAVFTTDLADRAYVDGRALTLGVNPMSGPSQPTVIVDDPSTSTPIEFYETYEAKFDGLDVPKMNLFLDGLVAEVGDRLIVDTGTGDVEEAEQRLWAADHQTNVFAWLAAALRSRGAIYHTESLFQRSFDASLHVAPVRMHFDCDQLVYIALYVARRLDLHVAALTAPEHMYVEYDAPTGSAPGTKPVYVDVATFDQVDDDATVDTLPKGFVIDANYYPSGRGGSWATDEFAAAAQYYQPQDEQALEDSIVANVMVGLRDGGHPGPEIAELAARVDASHEPTLVANLFRAYVEGGKAALDAGDLVTARKDAISAVSLRASKGALVWQGHRVESVLLARTDLAAGDNAAAEADLAPALQPYLDDGWTPGDDPVDDDQREILQLHSLIRR